MREENGAFQRPVPQGLKARPVGTALSLLQGAGSRRSSALPDAGAVSSRRARPERGQGSWARGPRAAWLGTDLGTDVAPAPSETRGRLPRWTARRLRRVRDGSRRQPSAAAPGARGSGPGTPARLPLPVGEPVLPAGPKCKAQLFPDAPGRGARQRAPSPQRACRARELVRGSGALTMEHGLREAGVVMMTAAAARAGSRGPWSLPGPRCARRCRESDRVAVSAAGSSAPRRARCFIHPRGGGTRHGCSGLGLS